MKSKIQIKTAIIDMRGRSDFTIKKTLRELALMPPVNIAAPGDGKIKRLNPEKNPKYKIVKKIYNGGLPGSGRKA